MWVVFSLFFWGFWGGGWCDGRERQKEHLLRYCRALVAKSCMDDISDGSVRGWRWFPSGLSFILDVRSVAFEFAAATASAGKLSQGTA